MENKQPVTGTNPPPAKPVTPVKEEKKDRKGGLIILIVLLILSNIALGVLYWMEKQRKDQVIVEKEQVMVEKTNVKSELEKLQQEYGELQTNDQKIQSELEEKRAEIAQLIQEAEKHKDDAKIMARLQRETETLRKIMKGYIRTIDSLGVLNQNLIVEKGKVEADLASEKGKGQQLVKEKEDLQNVVKVGSLLKANSLKATGVRFRSGGKKEIETNKARKAEKLKLSFVLGENRIAKKGSKDIYLRVVTPEGKELARSLDDANSFSFNGVRGFFCAKETINYDNSEKPMSMFAEMKEGFPPGRYMMEVYADEAMIGSTILLLE